MAVKIRLTRIGRHKDPIYRIVVAESKYARDGRFIEQIGFYNPSKPLSEATIEEEIALKWLCQGAQYSDTIKAILSEKGIIAKAKDIKSTLPAKEKVAKTSCPKDEEALKKAKQEKSLANKEAKAQKAERLKKQAEAKAQKEAEEAAQTANEEAPAEAQGE